MNPEFSDGSYSFAVTATTPTYPADLVGTSYTGVPTATGVYAHTGRTITQVGAFATYTFTAGDWYFLVSGAVAPVRSGWYRVASKTSDDVIVLADDGLGLASDGATTLVGMLHKQGPLVPDGPSSVHTPGRQILPEWNMRSLVLTRLNPLWTAAPGAVRTLTVIDVGGTTLSTYIAGVDPSAIGRVESPYQKIAVKRGVGARLANPDHPTRVEWRPSNA